MKSFADFNGKTILIGKGSLSAYEGTKHLKLFGFEGKVELANVELNAAVAALKNKQGWLRHSRFLPFTERDRSSSKLWRYCSFVGR